MIWDMGWGGKGGLGEYFVKKGVFFVPCFDCARAFFGLLWVVDFVVILSKIDYKMLGLI